VRIPELHWRTAPNRAPIMNTNSDANMAALQARLYEEVDTNMAHRTAIYCSAGWGNTLWI
jgi:hypothetical protein